MFSAGVLFALTSLIAAAPSTAPAPVKPKLELPHLRSETALIRFADTQEILLSKNADVVRPIASVTKLLSALVMSKLDAGPMEAYVTIGEDDKDRLKWSRSRLRVGLAFTPNDLFDAALGASDNRAMYASVRARGLTRDTFVERMNALAVELGMTKSAFKDPAGINPANVSTARDLLQLVAAAAENEAIRLSTHKTAIEMIDKNARALTLHNPNRLIHSASWDIVVGKTGYTVEAGRNLVIRTRIEGRPVDMVFLGAREMASVFGDAARVKKWLEEKMVREGLIALVPAGSSTAAIASFPGDSATSSAAMSMISIPLSEASIAPLSQP